jgi:hypothetical protein
MPWFQHLGSPNIQPDLVPREFHLFPKLMEHLRGHHFVLGDEFKTLVKFGFHHQDAQSYQMGLCN